MLEAADAVDAAAEKLGREADLGVADVGVADRSGTGVGGTGSFLVGGARFCGDRLRGCGCGAGGLVSPFALALAFASSATGGTPLTDAIAVSLRGSGRLDTVGEGVRVSSTGESNGAVLGSPPEGFRASEVGGGISMGCKIGLASCCVLFVTRGGVAGSGPAPDEETIVGPEIGGAG